MIDILCDLANEARPDRSERGAIVSEEISRIIGVGRFDMLFDRIFDIQNHGAGRLCAMREMAIGRSPRRKAVSLEASRDVAE
jgi:hypothetical protein